MQALTLLILYCTSVSLYWHFSTKIAPMDTCEGTKRGVTKCAQASLWKWRALSRLVLHPRNPNFISTMIKMKKKTKIFFSHFFLSRALCQRNYFKGDATNLATLVLQNQFLFWNRIGYSPGAKRKLTTKTTRTKKSSNWTETLVSKNWNKPCQYELYFIFLVWVFSLKKKSWFFYRVWSKHIAR